MTLSNRPLGPGDEALFVGRTAELHRVVSGARDGFNELVLGESGSGKTSLLNQARARLDALSGVRTRLVDGGLARDPAGFLDLVGAAVGARFDPRAEEPDEVGLLRKVQRLAEPLRQLAKGGARVVLLVDGVDDAAIVSDVFGRLRERLWELPAGWVVALDTRHRQAAVGLTGRFFDEVVALEPLTVAHAKALLAARLPAGHADAADDIATSTVGNPRDLVALARQVVRGQPVEEVVADDAELRRRVEELGQPAAVVVKELRRRGAVSASDPELLKALGWSRSRAAQVLGQLEEAGLVVATRQPGGVGRPKRVYGLA